MTDYTTAWWLSITGQPIRRSTDPDWHRHWWSSCAGDPEAAAFRRMFRSFPFHQFDAGTVDGHHHDFPPNPQIGPGRVR
jgi:hypothetical protein